MAWIFKNWDSNLWYILPKHTWRLVCFRSTKHDGSKHIQTLLLWHAVIVCNKGTLVGIEHNQWHSIHVITNSTSYLGLSVPANLPRLRIVRTWFSKACCNLSIALASSYFFTIEYSLLFNWNTKAMTGKTRPGEYNELYEMSLVYVFDDRHFKKAAFSFLSSN